MEPVLCEICNKLVSPEACWCVIDTQNKTRHFECKVSCKPKAKPPEPAPAPEPVLESFVIDIPDDVIIRTEEVPEWAEAYSRPSWFQLIKQWFTVRSGYTKVKTQ